MGVENYRTKIPLSYMDAWSLSTYPDEDLISLVSLHPCVEGMWIQMVIVNGINPTKLGPIRIKYGPDPWTLMMVASVEGSNYLMCMIVPARCWVWDHYWN